jgi:hypothetical protein
MKEPDKYYVTLGKVLAEDTIQARPEKKRSLGMIMKNDYALEQMARMYEDKCKTSSDSEMLNQLQMYEMRARGRMERENVK